MYRACTAYVVRASCVYDLPYTIVYTVWAVLRQTPAVTLRVCLSVSANTAVAGVRPVLYLLLRKADLGRSSDTRATR